MKIALALLLALFLGAPLGLRAGDGKFEIRAVAPHPGLPGSSEYLLDDGAGNPVKLSLGSEVLLDTTALASAEAKNEDGSWTIAVELTAAGKERFGEITAKYIDRRLAILVDGKVRCAPVIQTAILDGSFQINGEFTEEDAKQLVADLNAAAGKKAASTPAAAPTPMPGNP